VNAKILFISSKVSAWRHLGLAEPKFVNKQTKAAVSHCTYVGNISRITITFFPFQLRGPVAGGEEGVHEVLERVPGQSHPAPGTTYKLYIKHLKTSAALGLCRSTNDKKSRLKLSTSK
jgi:hypothetical protein